MIKTDHFINGVWCSSANHARGESIDPSNGSVVGHFSAGSKSEAEQAIQAARRAFDISAWAQSPRQRQNILLQWASAIEDHAGELAELLTRENGKPLVQSRGEVNGSVSEIRYYAGLCRHNPGHVQEVEPGALSLVTREPAGVAGMIIPWNAPYVLLIRSLAPALAVGCTTVVKPAPQTTLLTARILGLLAELEALPAGVLNMVGETGSEVAKTLVNSPDVDVISFTGSNNTGKRIMADAASTLKKLSLELGGKSCCVAFEDVDVETLAPNLAAAATIIAGQQCTAARRILVHASKLESLKQGLKRALENIQIGSGMNPDTQMGPLIDYQSRDQVWDRIQQTMQACDEVVLAGGIPEGSLKEGAYLKPTLVCHRDSSAFFCQEEIFGPLIILEPFETEAEAVSKVNNSVYGLSSSVWTHDLQRAYRVARALRRGTVWLNDHNKLFAEAETGGYRQSGLGRLHGYDALNDFTELKHIYNAVGVTGG